MATRLPHGPRRVLWLLAALAAASPALVGAEPLPERVAVTVSYGSPRGPEALRERLARDLIDALDSRGCFASFDLVPEAGPPDRELWLEVRIEDLEEETEFDRSLAEMSSSDLPPAMTGQRVARIEARFEVELRLSASGAIVRGKTLRHSNAWRPLLDEDPRHEAARQFAEEAARTISSFVCKGSRKARGQEIARAGEADRRP